MAARLGSPASTTTDSFSPPAPQAVCLFDVRDEQETDLVHMSHVDAPNILNTLHARHAAGEVYANVGAQSIVLSLNPYTWRPQVRARRVWPMTLRLMITMIWDLIK